MKYGVLTELCQRLSAVDDGTMQSTPSTRCYRSLSLADDVLWPRDDLTSSTLTYDSDSDVEVNVIDDGQLPVMY